MRNSPYGTVGPELVAAARWCVLLIFALIALAMLGHFATKAVVNDGVEDFDVPEVQEFAQDAVTGAWFLIDNPIQRIYIPAVRVTAVERIPGHCSDPTIPRGPRRDYRAEVRTYTLFAIPAGRLEVTCGGRHIGYR